MQQSMAPSSISSSLLVTYAAMVTMLRERWFLIARGGFALLWFVRPIFDLAIAGLIYAGGRPELLPYVVVGISANAFIMSAVHFLGEVLDRERMRGTLSALFLSPAPRLCWLTGYSLAASVETFLAAGVLVVAGIALFGVTFNVAPLSLVVVSTLFLASLAGIGLCFSAIGLLLRRSNAWSNLVIPVILVFGGIYYPVSELPRALRVIARMLPIGYAIEALALATLQAEPVSGMLHLIVPLAVFSALWLGVGLLALRWIDRVVRQRGEVDLY
jgi:ABC-type multidrug transport system permease subunit